MNKFSVVVISVLIVLCSILCAVISSKNATIREKTASIETARKDAEMLNTDLVRIKSSIDEAVRRLDAIIENMAREERDARERHEAREVAICEMEREGTPEVRNWLDDPVPDDVRLLFGAGAVCEGSTAGSSDNPVNADRAM